MALTKQQHDPHPRLLEVRNVLIESGMSRVEACAVCDGLTDEACDAVLSQGASAIEAGTVQRREKSKRQVGRPRTATRTVEKPAEPVSAETE